MITFLITLFLQPLLNTFSPKESRTRYIPFLKLQLLLQLLTNAAGDGMCCVGIRRHMFFVEKRVELAQLWSGFVLSVATQKRPSGKAPLHNLRPRNLTGLTSQLIRRPDVGFVQWLARRALIGPAYSAVVQREPYRLHSVMGTSLITLCSMLDHDFGTLSRKLLGFRNHNV